MKIINRLYITSGVVTFIAIAIVMAAVLDHYFNKDGKCPLVLILFFVGCLGGTANHFKRLQIIPFEDEELKSKISPGSVLVQTFVSPGLGGVFAVVAYLIFGGGLLIGPLFPAFNGTQDLYEAETSINGLFTLIPKTNKDVAIMLVWAFVAGFSEKFVPNILDKLAMESVSKQEKQIDSEKAEPKKNNSNSIVPKKLSGKA